MKKILIGSLVLTVLAAAIITVQMSSCTKTTAQATTVHDTVKVVVVDSVCPTSNNSITGLWVGNYLTNQIVTPPVPIYITIYPDGTLSSKELVFGTVGDYDYTTGSWTLTGNVFQYTDTTVVYGSGSPIIKSCKLIFNNIGTLSNGTWKDLSDRLTGTFTTFNRLN